jgi:4,5:9,10-diseco-3-hydroxy-5,9,17-trioxoandrosta-1(10),2-diene-4-oate hydrolase
VGGSAAGWLPSFEALSSQHRVYALDLIGHGRTDKPSAARISLPDLTNFVHDFMLEMKIDRAGLVGHSLGAGIVLQLAIDFPDCITKMVLVGSPGLGKEITPLFRLMSIPLLGEALASGAYTPDVKKFGDGLRAGTKNATYITDELVETLYRIEQKPDQYKMTLKILRSGVDWMGQKKSVYGIILQKLSSITCPTLLVWGEQDDIVPLKHAVHAARILPDARLETIERCGHIPMFDQPEIFNKLVLDFLKD